MSDTQAEQGTPNDDTTPTPGDTGSTWKPPASQEEFNRIIEGRVARERAKFSDYTDLKSQVQNFDKTLAEARKEAAREATNGFTQRLLNAEVKAQATALKFHDPTDALAGINDPGSLVTDKGEIDTDKLSAALTELAAKKPYLVKAEDGNTPPARRPGPRRATEDQAETPPTKASDMFRQLARTREL